jgi:YjbE family integral membrane protein
MLDSIVGPEVASLVMIIIIDIVMSGDNAIIIGMAAAGLPLELRRRAIIFGIAGATVIRIVFAASALYLLSIIGLLLAGGLLLAWVCWKMWGDLRRDLKPGADEAGEGGDGAPATKTLRAAMTTIIIADVSMSLDNVLAVAGAARDHLGMLVFGLILSIALMAVAANLIADVLERHKWIGYVGLAIIAYVAADMIWRGSQEVASQVSTLAF